MDRVKKTTYVVSMFYCGVFRWIFGDETHLMRFNFVVNPNHLNFT